MASRASKGRATKRASKAKRGSVTVTSRKATKSQMDKVLVELGRQALADGVKGVLEGHGINSAVSIELVPARKARKTATKRRTTRRGR